MATLTDAFQHLFASVGDVPSNIYRAVRNLETRSLNEVGQAASVEPLTVISKDCLTLSYTPDVLQSLLSLFAAYYLQAISIVGSVDSARVIRILDKLNPNRQFNDITVITESMPGYHLRHEESFKYRLPTPGNQIALESEVRRIRQEKKVALESVSDRVNMYDPVDVEDGALRSDADGLIQNRDNLKNIIETSNLSVGKLIAVRITIDEKEVEVPIAVRLATASMTGESIARLLAVKTDEESFIERWHAWRSGRIRLIQDLIFAQDLIDEHRKFMIKDEDGIYTEILNRVKRNKGYGFLSNNPSLATSSNIFIITEEDAKNIERKMSGKMSNKTVRDRLFKNTYAMIIAVVDREWERVTFYTRGISAGSTVSVKDLKQASQGKGPDIVDILKSLSMGSAPSF